MKFFSKIVFICNICFVAFVVLAYVELRQKKQTDTDHLIPLPFLQSTLVILGQFAIFLNFLFGLIYLVSYIAKKPQQISKWLVVTNYIFLLAQVYYFFIY